MTTLHPARRRAERFDHLVEGGRRDLVDRRTSDLLELVWALQSVPEPQPRPEFVSGLRERLMLAAETELAGVPARPAVQPVADRLTVPPRRTPRERRLAVALGSFAIVGATTSMAAAAQSALPGEPLYPLKRVIENTRAGFSVGDDAKGATLLDTASGRLDEVDALTSDGDADADTVVETLDTFSEQATEASDLLMSDYEQTGNESSIAELRDFTSTSMTTLSVLEADIPSAAVDSLLNAVQVLFTIDAAAGQVCPTCTTEGITEIPPQLLASGTETLDDAAHTLASGQLDEVADVSEEPRGGSPAPVTDNQQPTTEAGAPSGQDNLPAQVNAPDPAPTSSGQTSQGGGGSQGGTPPPSTDIGVNTGNGGKPPTPEPVNVPVVDEAVEDVVDGVNTALDGLTGAEVPPVLP